LTHIKVRLSLGYSEFWSQIFSFQSPDPRFPADNQSSQQVLRGVPITVVIQGDLQIYRSKGDGSTDFKVNFIPNFILIFMASGRYNLHALPSGLTTDGETFARVPHLGTCKGTVSATLEGSGGVD